MAHACPNQIGVHMPQRFLRHHAVPSWSVMLQIFLVDTKAPFCRHRHRGWAIIALSQTSHSHSPSTISQAIQWALWARRRPRVGTGMGVVSLWIQWLLSVSTPKLEDLAWDIHWCIFFLLKLKKYFKFCKIWFMLCMVLFLLTCRDCFQNYFTNVPKCVILY